MPRAGERLRGAVVLKGIALACARVAPDRRRLSAGAAKHTVTKSTRAAAVPPTTAPAWAMPAKPVGTTPPATPSPIKPIAILMSYASSFVGGQQLDLGLINCCPRRKLREQLRCHSFDVRHLSEMSNHVSVPVGISLLRTSKIYQVSSSRDALAR